MGSTLSGAHWFVLSLLLVNYLGILLLFILFVFFISVLFVVLCSLCLHIVLLLLFAHCAVATAVHLAVDSACI